jgi:hypothetical protein
MEVEGKESGQQKKEKIQDGNEIHALKICVPAAEHILYS